MEIYNDNFQKIKSQTREQSRNRRNYKDISEAEQVKYQTKNTLGLNKNSMYSFNSAKEIELSSVYETRHFSMKNSCMDSQYKYQKLVPRQLQNMGLKYLRYSNRLKEYNSFIQKQDTQKNASEEFTFKKSSNQFINQNSMDQFENVSPQQTIFQNIN